jgi:hypothetical protein
MAQITYRANLSAKSFPFLSQNWGRSVIVPQYDNTFSRQLASQEDTDKDVGLPQVYYCHNVMPQAQGFQSVGYTTLQAGSVLSYPASDIFIVRDSSGNAVYLMKDTAGNIYRQSSGSWVFVQNVGTQTVTTAYVAGITYIYVATVGCYKYDFSLNALTAVTLTGLSTATILGITYSAGYLIAWSSNSVAWSSTIDPTDFTPSLTTGAGGGSVESLRGTITCCVAHTLGFIVYSTDNAVAALFTSNAKYPFQFREIVASGGLSSAAQVSFDANSGNHYAYTTSGFQLVSTSQTQTILQEATDFIAGKLFEDYDESTDTFSVTVLTSTLLKQINLVADRYLVVSYGISALTHAVVYDLTDKRWGKLKITHVKCFEYKLPAAGVTEIPRQSIAFLGLDGSIKSVDFSPASTNSSGVICLGKYQFQRARLIQLDEVNVENIQPSATFSAYALSAIDGKNQIKSSLGLLASSGLYRKYGSRAIGINVSLVFKGAFNLVSLVLAFNIHGKR